MSVLKKWPLSILVTMGGSGSQLITQRTTPIVPPDSKSSLFFDHPIINDQVKVKIKNIVFV